MTSARRLVLYAGKYLGGFALARRLTRRRLRILCYHGFAVADEGRFRPGLFIDAPTLGRRLRAIARAGHPVLALDEAVERLYAGTLPPAAAVITIDDGFASTHPVVIEALRQFEIPLTVYVTTYYAVKQRPIFRLAVQYMFWKSRERTADLSRLGIPGVGRAELGDAETRERVMWRIIEHGEAAGDEGERDRLARALAAALAVDYGAIERQGLFTLMTVDQLRDLAEHGVDLQLHTHRHRLPPDRAGAHAEVRDNRAVLEPIAGRPLRHLCYPSGVWSRDHWPWLSAADVWSATTCDPGLNTAETPRLALRRFLDGSHVAQIEFEAELSGFKELLRAGRQSVGRLLGRPVASPDGAGGHAVD